MDVRITVLCENFVGKMMGLGEHGFAAFIETESGNYLFDTGRGRSIVTNALTSGKDLRTVSRIFLSHGHYDHTGGLEEVLGLRGQVMVHCHPDIFLERYAIFKENGREVKKFVGLPFKRVYLESLGANFVLNRDFVDIEKNIFLTGEVPRKTTFEKPDPRLFIETDGRMVQDLFLDDQSLVIDTKRGLILVLGCAHSGMVNIIKHVLGRIGERRFVAIVGGTHLDFLTPEQLEESIKFLKEIEVDTIAVAHCTGFGPSLRLRQEFGERFVYGCVGSFVEV